MNKEGYRDPTAEQAVRNASKTPRRVCEIIKILKDICRVSRLRIKHITLEDVDTGRRYQWRK